MQVMISPFYFPVTAQTFNFVCNYNIGFEGLLIDNLQACVIFGAVTIFGILCWYFTPEHKWLRKDHIIQAMEAADGKVTRDN
jgi:translation initiation factor 5B